MRFIFLFFILFFSYISNSFAQALPLDPTVAYAEARALLTTGTVQSTLNTGLRTRVQFAANGRIYTKALSIGKASVAAVIRSRAFSPWSLGVTAAITAAGYLLDTTNNTINGSVGANASDVGSCRCEGITTYGNGTYSSCFSNVNFVADCQHFSSNLIWIHGVDSQVYYLNSPTYPEPAFDLGADPTDAQLYDSTIPNISSSELNDFLNDPLTGRPYSSISEIQDAAIALDDEISRLNDTDPTNDPVNTTPSLSTTETLIQNSQNTVNNTDNTINPSSDNPPPPDYTFSSTVGNFDPTMDTVTKKLIPDTLGSLDSTVGGLTNKIGMNITAGGCVIPYSFAMGGAIANSQFSFCEFDSVFTSMGYIIFAFSLLVSGYILIGSRG